MQGRPIYTTWSFDKITDTRLGKSVQILHNQKEGWELYNDYNELVEYTFSDDTMDCSYAM